MTKTPQPSEEHTDRDRILSELIGIISKAVPDVLWSESVSCPDGLPGCLMMHYETKYRSITLEDFLIAYQKDQNSRRIVIDEVGRFWDLYSSQFMNCMWEIGKPLSDQSKETLAFLLNLLRPTNN